jgi:hypothetical protein
MQRRHCHPASALALELRFPRSFCRPRLQRGRADTAMGAICSGSLRCFIVSKTTANRNKKSKICGYKSPFHRRISSCDPS